MARETCDTCKRPKSVCLCSRVHPIGNKVEVLILQHPSEAKVVKGTARLAHLCLLNSQLWQGEQFCEESALQEWLSHGRVVCLYPDFETPVGMDASQIGQSISVTELLDETALEKIKLLVLDGTWRKTHKMMMLNPCLQKLDRLQLAPSSPSMYHIRKQKDANSLSTIEAIYTALSQLEGEERMEPLMTSFEAMLKQLSAFRPSSAEFKR